MKADTVGEVKKLAEYLGVAVSDELCGKIAAAVGFENQKKQEEKRQTDAINKVNFYRKGEVENWKKYLTVAQSERFDQMMKDNASDIPFYRRYLPDK